MGRIGRRWRKSGLKCSILSSKARWFRAMNCNLCDDFFLTGSKTFTHVEYLDLSGNNFTILPEFFKELQFLRALMVSDCEHLQEIRGLPPNLEFFDARNCASLTSSSKSMLLNQVLSSLLLYRIRWCIVHLMLLNLWFLYEWWLTETAWGWRNQFYVYRNKYTSVVRSAKQWTFKFFLVS